MGEPSNKEIYSAFKKAPFKVKITAPIMLIMKFLGYYISDFGWYCFKLSLKTENKIDEWGSKMFNWAWND